MLNDIKKNVLVFPKLLMYLGFLLLPFLFLKLYKNLTVSDIFFIFSFIFLSLIIIPVNMKYYFHSIGINNIFLFPICLMGIGFLFSLPNSFFPIESLTAFSQVIFIFCIVYPLLTLLIETPDMVNKCMTLLAISTSIIAIAILMFSIFGVDLSAGLLLLEKGWGGHRFSFGGLEPNVAGRIVLQIIPIFCSFIFLIRLKWVKIIYFIIILMSLYVVITTGSRSCLLALLCGIILFPNFLKKAKPTISLVKVYCFMGLLATIVGFYFIKKIEFTDLIERYTTIFSIKSSYSSLQRMNLIDQAIEYIVKHPFIGAGFENFYLLTDEKINVHNPILAIWAENGMIAMIGFFLIYLNIIVICIRSWQNNFFGDILLMGMTIMAIVMVVGDMFMANSYKRILWVPSLLFIHYYNLLKDKNFKIKDLILT